MAKAPPMKYEDTLAMPGSELYDHLIKGDRKKAEQSYKETEKRHQQLMDRIDKQEQKNVRKEDDLRGSPDSTGLNKVGDIG